MKGKKQQKFKRRIFRSYITSTISISLVLFMVGFLCLLVFNAEKLTDYVRENIGFTLILNEDVSGTELANLQKSLDASEYVKSTKYIDKETAARQLTNDLGEDFQGFLGFNPLLSTIDVKLRAEYTNPDKVSQIEASLKKFPQVKEVHYQKDVVNTISKNVQKFSLFVLLLSILLLFIFVSLINNTIRISIYSQRFMINTMQLVGATWGFIRKPFIVKSIRYGLIGALISNIIILVLALSYGSEFNEVVNPADFETLGVVFIIVFIMGTLISWLSTYFAVNKFLNMEFDELFY